MGTSYLRGCILKKKIKIKSKIKSSRYYPKMFARDTRDTRARRPYQI